MSRENKLVTCPYNAAHKMKESRMQLHIAKCKLNHLEVDKIPCPFNATHLIFRSEMDHHLLICADKAPLDRLASKDLDKNNPLKGRTAVPGYSEPLISLEESWDTDEVESYVPRKAPPPGSIIEPRPMAKPAERKKLYMELHQMTDDVQSSQTATPSTSAANSPALKPSPVPRQPKQPSETQKLQSVHQQQVNSQAIQNLGLGRGRPPRIAANIFENNNSVAGGVESMSYNNVVKNMSNLGLGRGQNASQGTVPLFNDDDDFPALGCGRGVFHASKQNLRSPGVRK